MISYIVGTLEEIEDNHVVVECGGIGYEIFVSQTTLYQYQKMGERIKIYTYLYVKEDLLQLFGFSTREEQQLFLLLISVNGIGPKGALSILSSLSPSDLRFAILAEDAGAIAKAPGIGSKTAQRVIIDLKDKVDQVLPSGGFSQQEENASSALRRDVIDALSTLGYSSSQTLRAMEEIEITDDTSLETAIKLVLQKLSFL